MNYIPVSLENQTNQHAGTSEVTNLNAGTSKVTTSAVTLQTPNAYASEEEDEAEDLIIVPTTVRQVGPRKSSTSLKAQDFLTELQNLKTQEKEAYSTGISEDTPEILAFRRELDDLAQKNLREIPKNKATSTNLVNSGSGIDDAQPADQDDSDMPEFTIFNKPQQGIFDEAYYDDEGMVHDFNNLPTEQSTSTFRSTCKKKTDMDGAVYIFKACLVAKEFTQTYGIDYEETFSPVADIRAKRILIAIAAYYDYEIWKMDVKTAFLNGHLSEEVYMEQPEGFIDPKYPNHVCKLKRSFYGLKQASRQWNKRFDDEIKKFGFTQYRDEPCVYLKSSGSYIDILILYVDDILLMGNNISMLQDVKSYLGKCFAMKDLSDAAYILGIKIYRDRSKRLIGLCQSAYIEKILKRYSMENSKRRTISMQEKLKLSKSQGASTAEIQCMQKIPYALVVGSIMYDVRCAHPDVAFAQNMTSRFQQNLGEIHLTTVKNILKYLQNTKDMFLVYGGNMERELRVSCYTDAGYLTDADTLRSQTGYVFVLNGGAVDWKSTKQSIFATSSIDAEYIAAFDASKEAVWIRKFIYGLGIVPTIEEPISTGAIAIAKDHGITKGARHFRAKVHYRCETIEMGDVKIKKIYTEDNLADPFTKALAYPKHSELTKNIGLIPSSSLM
ncbi:retrotransposon protein, putative, ty1-copia subclass [Tanacetum coccineum]|uniref:Retrotransposon protein, putative, ty1-copia subclass n=1 Tax=Tanacetum coccineum TaxID=301880 RepID=A0ABQ5D3U1_9ASTR